MSKLSYKAVIDYVQRSSRRRWQTNASAAVLDIPAACSAAAAARLAAAAAVAGARAAAVLQAALADRAPAACDLAQ